MLMQIIELILPNKQIVEKDCSEIAGEHLASFETVANYCQKHSKASQKFCCFAEETTNGC
jgi:hypothetical protein